MPHHEGLAPPAHSPRRHARGVRRGGGVGPPLLPDSATTELFLGAAIHETSQVVGAAAGSKPASWRSEVPAFILGFVALAILRSIGDGMLDTGGRAWGLWDRAAWSSLASPQGDTVGPRWLLGTAMAAAGLAGALVVGAVGMAMVLLLGRLVRN